MKLLSLYDYTGVMGRPWAEAGADVYCYDIQHPKWSSRTEAVGKGRIHFLHADLHSQYDLDGIYHTHKGSVDFLVGFPVCTDLAICGNKSKVAKLALNPNVEIEATNHAINCAELALNLGCPYMIENPVSRLATLWRKPDHSFHPYEFGGYLSDSEAVHPTWPDYIAPRDAYSKKTCLWTSNSFVFPEKKPVDCESFGASTQYRKLGGKSIKTKNIRSATPRGFAKAVFLANSRGL